MPNTRHMTLGEFALLRGHILSGGDLVLTATVETPSGPHELRVAVPAQHVRLQRYETGIKVDLLVPMVAAAAAPVQ